MDSVDKDRDGQTLLQTSKSRGRGPGREWPGAGEGWCPHAAPLTRPVFSIVWVINISLIRNFHNF